MTDIQTSGLQFIQISNLFNANFHEFWFQERLSLGSVAWGFSIICCRGDSFGSFHCSHSQLSLSVTLSTLYSRCFPFLSRQLSSSLYACFNLRSSFVAHVATFFVLPPLDRRPSCNNSRTDVFSNKG